MHLPNGKCIFLLEQATGVEPASVAWEATVLPMNYACSFMSLYIMLLSAQNVKLFEAVRPAFQKSFCRRRPRCNKSARRSRLFRQEAFRKADPPPPR